MGTYLQKTGVGQAGHLSVQRQHLQVSAGIVVGNEAVEQAGATGHFEGGNDGTPIQRSDQTAT